ncbi:lecithin retinol acyltransferase family protein [Mesonia sp.]|uniref:lecithin retinol acyltransferase family protein n=1 Tax=Mesonia sp. TaxID=1960830 RepID=UPI0025B7F76C|nr:lecithin retinol acyltransferase family protein [Mesonia sp.]
MINTLPNISTLYPGDVILAKKRRGLGRILNHYIVYAGNNIFIGNISDGVKELSYPELIMLLQDYEPIKVRRFNGSYFQRNEAVNRAYSKLGQRYSLLNFNCEHFANWVQFGKVESSQVTTGLIILTSAIFLKLISTDE